MTEQEAAEQASKDWLRKNEGQSSLESYLGQNSGKPIISQNITLQKIQITIVKSEFQRLIRVLRTCQPEMKMESLKQIQRIFPSALNLFEETQDSELRELISQVESLAKVETHPK